MATIRISELRATGSTGGTGEGISLDGETVVTAGTTETYFITNHDDFSIYTVESNIGTATISNDTITLVIPSGVTEEYLTLTVTRNGTPKDFQIGIGASSVATPVIQSPANNSTSVPTSVTLQATAFTTVPVGVGSQIDSQWQVASDAGFTNIIASETKTTGNLAQYTVSNLPRGTVIYARVRYNSSIGLSNWSTTVSFTTVDNAINKPTVTIPTGTVDVRETPTFNSSAFSATPVGSDTHVATSWVIRKESDSSIVWQLNSSATNKTSVTIPSGILQVNTQYTMSVQYTGGFGSSPWSDPLFFTTAIEFWPVSPGEPYGGGYYAGADIRVGNSVYALIVAPKLLGGQTVDTVTMYAPRNTSYATSRSNGFTNTLELHNAGLNLPAVNFVRGLNINGYNDWYIPSQDELEIMYRYLKPTTVSNRVSGSNSNSIPPGAPYTSSNPSITTSSLFRVGADTEFLGWANPGTITPHHTYLSSSLGQGPTGPRVSYDQVFTGSLAGLQSLDFGPGGNQGLVRAVRRVFKYNT